MATFAKAYGRGWLGQPGADDLGDGLGVSAAHDPLTIEGPIEDYAHSARRVREHGGENVAAVTPNRLTSCPLGGD
jgi:hypothetical protein